MSDLTSLTDRELLARTAKGDTTAYGCLYDRYVDPIYRYIYFRLNNREESEDLVETAFLKTFEVIRQDPGKIDQIKPWLYRTAHNLVIDHYRTRKNHLPMDAVANKRDGKELPEMDVINGEEQSNLKRALEMLSPEQQQIVIFRFIHGLTHDETSEIMGLKASYLRVLQYRALQKLREILKELEVHE